MLLLMPLPVAQLALSDSTESSSASHLACHWQAYALLGHEWSTQNSQPCRIQVLGQSFHVQENFAHHVILPLQLQRHPWRQPRNSKRIVGHARQPKCRVIVNQDCETA